MSSVYLYAITDGRHAELPEDVRSIPVDGIAGVYGPAPEEAPQANEANLWAHEAVVEALMEQGAVLPARFGTVLESVDRLREELRSRQEEFARALDHVRGRVELGVRAAWPERSAVGAPAKSGREYLGRRLEEERAATEAAEGLHEPLTRLAVDSTVQIEHSPCLTLVASYLVDRADVAAFRDEAERLARALEGVTLACTGPWPPYNFTTQDDGS